MEITSDIILKGKEWNTAINNLSYLFVKTNYSVFLLSLVIGIIYDKTINFLEEDENHNYSVPRNVIHNNDNGLLDTIFQTAILFTKTVDYDEKARLELAFGDTQNINKINFLIPFANFGVTILVKVISNVELETLDQLKDFLITTAEGKNIEINSIPDDILLGS